jgi:hypothetical protein
MRGEEQGYDGVIACIEVGGSGMQTVVFAPAQPPRIIPGATLDGADVCGLAVPGLVRDGWVVAASNLGWFDVDPSVELGLPRRARIVMNDAEAAALGEATLRSVDELTYVCLGTGVGGAVARDGVVVADNLFGHAGGFSDDDCRCGQRGCLETVASGWALPTPLRPDTPAEVAAAVARAIRDEPQSTELVVVAGGLVRTAPSIVAALASELPDRRVEPSAAPPGAKSAAAWGLRRAIVERLTEEVTNASA